MLIPFAALPQGRCHMNARTVMLTGVGGGGHGEQILKALRLAPEPYTIVGGDMSRHAKGLAEVDYAYVLPPANDPDYLPTIFGLCRRHDAATLIHGSEPELRVMSARRQDIQGAGLFLPINPAEVIDLCMDKVKTAEALQSHGFNAPAFCHARSLDEIVAFDRLPVVIKPSRGGGGSANVFLAQTRDQLQTFGSYVLSQSDGCIVQEYVGTPDQEYTVGVLLSMDGELLNSIAVKREILSSLSNRLKVRNLTRRADLGPVLAISNGISQGTIGRFPEVTEPCERIAVALGCRGPVNIQCRLVDGRVSVFEINPRFSGTTSLRALVGYNEPDVLIRRHLLGERIEPQFAYGSGVIARGLTEMLMDGVNASG